MANTDGKHEAWVFLCVGNLISAVIDDGLELFRVANDNARHLERMLVARR